MFPNLPFIGFGVLSLFWIDVTLLVQSLVFGAQLILTGIREAGRLIGTRTPKAPKAPGFWRRFVRTTTAIVTLAVVIAAAAFTFNVRGGAPREPVRRGISIRTHKTDSRRSES
ncbi:hypothetical protein [Neomicrococcus lactis]|uniref:hypothetical protein n=1 Tax=Neomicrococcus lactis TaxID=732241 RepID=UPI00230175D3|nr:hypothetical protein [Neomicrococcus lactis]